MDRGPGSIERVQMRASNGLLACLLWTVAGCVAGTDGIDPEGRGDDAAFAAPDLADLSGNKADFITDGLATVTPLRSGVAAVGQFPVAGFVGFEIAARAGDRLTIEVSTATVGTDPVAFLYEPVGAACGFDAPVARADDRDWPHDLSAVIADVEVAVDGMQLLVIADKALSGGDYRVDLACSGAGCDAADLCGGIANRSCGSGTCDRDASCFASSGQCVGAIPTSTGLPFSLAGRATLHSLIGTADGGYLAAGCRNDDALLVKLNGLGGIDWMKSYGGIRTDCALSVTEGHGGGYLFAGRTRSFGAAFDDAWLVKVNDAGSIEWERTYGGNVTDQATSVVRSATGYVFVGGLDSKMWLVEVDDDGLVHWEKRFAVGQQYAKLVRTRDDGYAIASGTLGSPGGDLLMIKVDHAGDTLWARSFPAVSEQRLRDVAETADGHLVWVGDGGINGRDAIVIATTGTGNVLWERTFHGWSQQSFHDVTIADNGDLLLTGTSESHYAPPSGNTITFGDYWIVRTNAIGQTQWQRALKYAYYGDVIGTAMVETPSGGIYAVANIGTFYGVEGGGDLIGGCGSTWVDSAIGSELLGYAPSALATVGEPTLALSLPSEAMVTPLTPAPVGLCGAP